VTAPPADNYPAVSRMMWLRRLASTAAIFVLCFLCVEYVVRSRIMPASRSYRLMDTVYPAQAEELGQQKGVRVAIVGNSSTERGVDAGVCQERLQSLGIADVSARVFTFDGSDVPEWNYILNRYFWHAGIKPELVILPFFFHGLAAEEPVDVGRLAYCFTTSDDWLELFSHEPSLNWRIEFLLSTNWASFALDGRVQRRLFPWLIPNYQPFARELHDAEISHRTRRRVAAPPVVLPSHRALQRLLLHAQQEGALLCFVAFPARDVKYELASQEIALIRQAGMEFIDMRSVDGLTPAMYEDYIHLLTPGQKLFSRRLAESVADIVRKRAASPATLSRRVPSPVVAVHSHRSPGGPTRPFKDEGRRGP